MHVLQHEAHKETVLGLDLCVLSTEHLEDPVHDAFAKHDRFIGLEVLGLRRGLFPGLRLRLITRWAIVAGEALACLRLGLVLILGLRHDHDTGRAVIGGLAVAFIVVRFGHEGVTALHSVSVSFTLGSDRGRHREQREHQGKGREQRHPFHVDLPSCELPMVETPERWLIRRARSDSSLIPSALPTVGGCQSSATRLL